TTVGGYVTAASCTARGQVASRTLGNGVTETRSYDSNRTWLAGNTAKTSTGAVLQQETYTRNHAAQVTAKNSTDAADRWTYGYDPIGRLASAVHATNTAWNLSVAYDAAGRITNKTGVGAFTYPAVNTAGKPDHAPA